ncbi:hypothetical protein ABZ725_14160 [Streptomyces sp. NPDC006872]|uniref:hypothetical protein n=1 Tax=Streptomyces sp. NPDC006872 TaxID=3155720 RepID=UPI0033F349E1
MNGPELQPDDVAVMRREDPDGWRRYMRQQITNGKARLEQPAKPKPPPPPGRRPGAWPTGSSPPGPPPERSLPKAAWDAAVRHYRNEENRPDQPCDCGNCPLKESR